MKIMKRQIPTKVKRVIAIILALLLIIALNMGSAKAGGSGYHADNILDRTKSINSAYQSQNHFGGNTYASPAFDFHIFAEEVTLGGHTNGNIATNILHANTHTFGATQVNHLGKREDNYIGKSAEALSNINSNGNIIVGSTVVTSYSKQEQRVSIGNHSNPFDQQTSKKVYLETTSSTPYIDIASELSNLSVISRQLSQKESSKDVTLSKVSGEHQTITVSGSGINHYLNVSAADISAGNNKRILNITIPSSTTLIINVDMKGASIHSLKNLVTCLNGHHNGEQVIANACGLMWNLYDSSNPNRLFVTSDYACVGCSDYFFGTILAPAAQIQYGAVNGSIIAKKTYQAGQESHRFDFTGYTDPEPESTTTEEKTTEITTSEATTTTEKTTEITTSEAPTTTEKSTEITTSEAPTTTEKSTEITTSEAPTTTEKTTEITTSEALTTTEKSTEITTSEAPTTTEKSTEITTSEAPTTTEKSTEITTSEAPTTTEKSTEITTSEVPTTTEKSTEITTSEAPATTEKSTEITTSEAPTTTEKSTEVSTTEQILVKHPVSSSSSITLSAQKILKDKKLKDKQFTFQIIDGNDTVISTAQNDSSGKITFTPITFQSSGFYQYYIVEVNDAQDNIRYDNSRYLVTIQVTRYGDGSMTASAQYEDNPVFTNLYVKETETVIPQNDTSKTPTAGNVKNTAKTGDDTTPMFLILGIITSLGLCTTLGIYYISTKKKQK